MAIGNTPSGEVLQPKALLLAEEKSAFDGRAFGDENLPISKNIVCLAYNLDNLPTYWHEIEGLNECGIAPGSIAIHPDSKSVFMLTTHGSWVLWSGGSNTSEQGGTR